MRILLAYTVCLSLFVVGAITKNQLSLILGQLGFALTLVFHSLTDAILIASNTIADAMPQGPDEDEGL